MKLFINKIDRPFAVKSIDESYSLYNTLINCMIVPQKARKYKQI